MRLVHLFTSIKDGKTLEEIEEKFKLNRTRANEIVLFQLDSGFISEKMVFIDLVKFFIQSLRPNYLRDFLVILKIYL
jgi:hypothetical protein